MADTRPANAAKLDSSCLSGLFKSSETLSAWKKSKTRHIKLSLQETALKLCFQCEMHTVIEENVLFQSEEMNIVRYFTFGNKSACADIC